jgi:hypothetical protein
MLAVIEKAWGEGDSAGRIVIMVNEEFGTSFSRNAVMGKIHRNGLLRAPGAPARPLPTIRTARPVRRSPFRSVKAFRQPPAALPPQVVIAEIDPALHVQLMELEEGMCKWPVADGFYCGAPVAFKRKPYCSIHSQLGREGPRKPRDPDAVKYVPMPTKGKYFG